MSFDRLDSLESQPTTMRRSDDPEYRDDPEFDRFTENLSNKLFSLTSNITRLSDQIVLLGTRRDTERVRERVHTLLEQTRAGFKDAAEGIKKVQMWEDVNPSQKWTQQKLSSEFRATLDEFQTIQRRALEKQRASAVAARTAVEEGELSAEGHGGEQQQQLQQQLEEQQPRLANQDEVDFQESLIIERETEIRNIEQSVGELNELFRDVAHIVHEQGGQLDIISDNVENVTHDTRGANVELRSASRHQKNARNKACCLLVILAVILLIIVLAATLG
ncbi:t-SNARE [Aspergillus campestris IBT 28561]|uniref:t-SNARE n=1 Tax=Aspergillus campestris (strain IBT 28561) TaxID=1392248 RepID=A0A2I1CX61_ASPC2|nr:t-SNARE [Aspergillus campestris IBT 28561]PKY02199.1 t-SNARE [Aspergillus campestris IBT 28561]